VAATLRLWYDALQSWTIHLLMSESDMKLRSNPALQETIAKAKAIWLRLAVCPKFADDENYKSATQWIENFTPSSSSEGYDKALAYAWRKYDQVTSASEALDKKADNLMRNAGLVAGLLGLAINTIQIGYPQWLIPSLVAFTASLMLAAFACNPTGGATTASVQDVLDDVTSGHSSDAWIAASISCAIAGRSAMNNWKAERIRWATYAFCAGLSLFLVPVAVMWLF
jgi:hypothetical protein